MPARVTARLLALAAPLGRGSFGRAMSVWARDRRMTESLNAGHRMATMAFKRYLSLAQSGRDADMARRQIRQLGSWRANAMHIDGDTRRTDKSGVRVDVRCRYGSPRLGTAVRIARIRAQRRAH